MCLPGYYESEALNSIFAYALVAKLGVTSGFFTFDSQIGEMNGCGSNRGMPRIALTTSGLQLPQRSRQPILLTRRPEGPARARPEAVDERKRQRL